MNAPQAPSPQARAALAWAHGARFVTTASRLDQLPVHDAPEIAFVGRSNVGKSSCLNTLVGQSALARVSKTPGRTQAINFFDLSRGGRSLRFADLPGYGFAKVPRPMQEHWGRLLTEYFSIRESLRGLFIVMDIRRPLGDQDWQMLEFAASRQRLVHLLLTKTDKVGRNEAATALRRVRAAVKGRATAQLFSATSKEGVDVARKCLEEMLGT